jgi:phytoene dehydrogenase-like protein
MPTRHYDVVVLGTGLGAAATAALLARRSFRVLVLGQARTPLLYRYDGMPLARRAPTFLAQSAPVFRRILAELSQLTPLRRRARQLDPMFQALTPSARIDVPPDTALFAREIEREMPELRRQTDELYGELARGNAAADAALDADVTLPPDGFWERRDARRILAALPHLDVPAERLVAEIPPDHAYRAIALATARFASDAATPLSGFAFARLHGAWTRGITTTPFGEADVVELLLERVRAHGGEVRANERADAILVKSGKVAALRTAEEGEVVGAEFVVGDMPVRSLLALCQGYEPSPRALATLPPLEPARWRFVASAIVADAGLPAALAAESFFADARRGVFHVTRVREGTGIPTNASLVVVEALLDRPEPPRGMRGTIVRRLKQIAPFFERHLLVLDSPHDGEPLVDLRAGENAIPRTLLRAGGAFVDPEPMPAQYRTSDELFGGLGGDPARALAQGLFAVGRSLLPALGQEGELLGAWGVARVITKTDRRRERLRKELWSKLEVR